MNTAAAIPLQDIKRAQVNIKEHVLRTPLIHFEQDNPAYEIYLKAENLQPIGSFKLRGACNAMTEINPSNLREGVYTASAGNMAQGVAWNARMRNIPCTVYVPEQAPQTKLDAIERLGAKFVKLPFDEWWQILVNHEREGAQGQFIHPVSRPDVIAGNGTVGLEILEDLPHVDAIVIPFGGGGLSTGIASAVKALNSDIRVFASEVETACPLAESLTANRPLNIDYRASFVDGIGSGGILTEMWEMVSTLLDGSIVVSLQEVSNAIRQMIVQNRIIAEGAGGSSLAAALTGKAGLGKIVCVISGGNIDFSKLEVIMRGEIPH